MKFRLSTILLLLVIASVLLAWYVERNRLINRIDKSSTATADIHFGSIWRHSASHAYAEWCRIEQLTIDELRIENEKRLIREIQLHFFYHDEICAYNSYDVDYHDPRQIVRKMLFALDCDSTDYYFQLLRKHYPNTWPDCLDSSTADYRNLKLFIENELAIDDPTILEEFRQDRELHRN